MARFTPLASVASATKPEIVEYLLKQSTDLTLSGCNQEDHHYDALGAARNSLKSNEAALATYLNPEPSCPSFLSTPRVGMTISIPTTLLNKKANLERSVQLLEVASSFWQRNLYNSSHHHKQRHLRGYPENPFDLDALNSALDKVSRANPAERNSEDVNLLAAQFVTRRQREQELRLAAERKRELKNNANGNRKKQKRFRFRSLM